MFVIIIFNNEVTEIFEECLTFDAAVRYAADKYQLTDHEVEKLYERKYLILKCNNDEMQIYIGKVEDVKQP